MPDQARRHIGKACLDLAAGPLLAQHDRAAIIENDDVERFRNQLSAAPSWFDR
jgi:hypothetical protein